MSLIKWLIHEVHRRSLWQVMGIYLAGSWGVLQVVDILTQSAGLPDWTPTFAIVLLLIGLPICLATAFVQEGISGPRRSTPPSDGEHTDPAAPPAPNLAAGTGSLDRPSTRPPWIKRFLTWRKALVGGVLAFTLLGVSVVAYVIMWSAGIGPVGNLVAQGVFEEGGTVVLADFADRAGGAGLADVVTQALRVDLQSSPIINVVPPARVGAVLARMELAGDLRLTRELAREVAVRDGYSAVLQGQVAGVGRGFVLTASLVTALSGDVLAAFRTTAESEDDLLAAIDKLSQDIREKAGESLRSIRAGEPLAVVTTGSLYALRSYGRAEAMAFQGREAEAIPLLEEALELDQEFAMVYRKLAVLLGNSGIDPERAQVAATRAYELRHRLTARERGLAEAYYFSTVEIDSDRSMDAYRRVLEDHPNDPVALNNLGLTGMFWGLYEEAQGVLRRAVDGPFPGINAHSNLIAVLWSQGKEEEAWSSLDRMEAEFPNATWTQYGRLSLLMAEARWPEAHAQAESLVRAAPQSVGIRVTGLVEMAASDLGRGHWREAMEHLERAEQAALDAGQPELYITSPVFARAIAHFGVRGSLEDARRTLTDALERFPLDSLARGGGVERIALVAAMLGLSDAADAAFARYERDRKGGGGRDHQLTRQVFLALSAFGTGEWGVAVAELERLFTDVWPCAPACYGKIELGIALAEAGRTDEAIQALEEGLARYPLDLGAVFVVPLMPLALDRLARL